MTDRRHRWKVLVTCVREYGAARQQACEPFFVFAAEPQQVIVTELVYRNGKDQFWLLPPRPVPRQPIRLRELFS